MALISNVAQRGGSGVLILLSERVSLESLTDVLEESYSD